MPEVDTIRALSSGPNTVETMTGDLRALGVAQGMTLIVHSSLSSLGWVCGGAVGLILALQSALGRAGTLVMPTHSGDLSDPAPWENPPVPQEWWQTIRETMPVFNRDLTPTRGVGVVPETFRKQEGVVRSDHPTTSFAAWGRHRRYIVRGQRLEYSMDSHSPLGRIYRLGGYVLLIGVGHERNTSIHLAVYMANYEGKRIVDCYSPLAVKGRRQWGEVSGSGVQLGRFRTDWQGLRRAEERLILKRQDRACSRNIHTATRPGGLLCEMDGGESESTRQAGVTAAWP